MPITYASYACHPEASRGRVFKEEEPPDRSCFQRDRDRIIHSTAFRRLEYKTQVFVNHEGDHYRTRLTHSLEVAQLARSIGRELGLNEDLAEALALAHDLGHPPFGHAGEEALQQSTKEFGGFDHNAHGLRVLTLLEQKYAAFNGLNLTWETLEGIAKHNGPVKNPPWAMREVDAVLKLELHTHPSLEAQVAALCDDIAYVTHDIEDGLRAQLISVKDLYDVPMAGAIFRGVLSTYPTLSESRLIHETKRRMINGMAQDLTSTTRERLEASGAKTVEDIRNHGTPIASFSDQMWQDIKVVKSFLYARMYRHYKVNRMTSKARKLLTDLFAFFHKEPECLPPHWCAKAGEPLSEDCARVVCDYIAGMTDRFALEEYRRVFDISYKIIGE